MKLIDLLKVEDPKLGRRTTATRASAGIGRTTLCRGKLYEPLICSFQDSVTVTVTTVYVYEAYHSKKLLSNG